MFMCILEGSMCSYGELVSELGMFKVVCVIG